MPPDAAKFQPGNANRHSAERNRLLRRLPEEDYASLLPELIPVALAAGQTLYEPGARIPSVYFPETATLAIMAELHRDGPIEVGNVGNEGFAGIPILLGAPSMPYRAIVQIPGESMRMSVDAFRAALDDHPAVRNEFLRYTLYLLQQIAQMVACNRLHSLTQRCARWMLVARDRVQADTFPLTQGFLAELLGVRRPGVSVTAGMLQRAGLIRYSRGKVTILNRAGLEKVSCECYQTMRDAYARLFPGDRPGVEQTVRESALRE